MRFKSNKQRKAVMAKLNSKTKVWYQTSPTSKIAAEVLYPSNKKVLIWTREDTRYWVDRNKLSLRRKNLPLGRAIIKRKFTKIEEVKISNNNKAVSLVNKVNDHSWVPIKDKETATRLIPERMDKERINAPLWKNLSKNKDSTKLFKKFEIDPSEAIVMVDIDFLSKRKGNRITQEEDGYKSVDRIKKVIKSGKKLNSVPVFNIRRNKVGEGNHRVEALRQLGYKSAPVQISGAWD